MKTELITNVSHDLKTPLTAIITYVDLLKKEDITEEERKEYVATLEKKSQRLKVLIEDLFEISKATTDNIVMNYDEVDLVSLIKEVRLENEDKIQSSTRISGGVCRRRNASCVWIRREPSVLLITWCRIF